MVEGPAELFLIPVSLKQVMEVNLDELGISVIPIYGVHFDAYAKLFGPDAITKKCAIVADSDLTPSDAVNDGDEDIPEPPKPNIASLENQYVKLFLCRTTFERAITAPGTMAMFAEAAKELGAVKITDRLMDILNDTDWTMPLSEEAKERLNHARDSVLNTAKRFGKARFAQVASKHVGLATWIPRYLEDAVEWLTTK